MSQHLQIPQSYFRSWASWRCLLRSEWCLCRTRTRVCKVWYDDLIGILLGCRCTREIGFVGRIRRRVAVVVVCCSCRPTSRRCREEEMLNSPLSLLLGCSQLDKSSGHDSVKSLNGCRWRVHEVRRWRWIRRGRGVVCFDWKNEIVRVLVDLTLISLDRYRERTRSSEQLT